MEAIRSVQNQTYNPIEIIVVDDGSTDSETVKILEELEKDTARVFRVDHLGPAAARNYGISEAKGRYILPLDADDKIAPTYIEKAVAVLKHNDHVGVVYCYADLFGEQTGRWQLPDYSLDRMLLDNIVFVTALFYREDWEKVGGFCNSMSHGMEDYDFWLSLLELGREIYQIPEVLFFYRIKPTSRTTILKDSCEKMQSMYGQIFENHKALYQKHYDIVIPILRNTLLEQISARAKAESMFAWLDKVRRVPVLRKIAKWIIRRT